MMLMHGIWVTSVIVLLCVCVCVCVCYCRWVTQRWPRPSSRTASTSTRRRSTRTSSMASRRCCAATSPTDVRSCSTGLWTDVSSPTPVDGIRSTAIFTSPELIARKTTARSDASRPTLRPASLWEALKPDSISLVRIRSVFILQHCV